MAVFFECDAAESKVIFNELPSTHIHETSAQNTICSEHKTVLNTYINKDKISCHDSIDFSIYKFKKRSCYESNNETTHKTTNNAHNNDIKQPSGRSRNDLKPFGLHIQTFPPQAVATHVFEMQTPGEVRLDAQEKKAGKESMRLHINILVVAQIHIHMGSYLSIWGP